MTYAGGLFTAAGDPDKDRPGRRTGRGVGESLSSRPDVARDLAATIPPADLVSAGGQLARLDAGRGRDQAAIGGPLGEHQAAIAAVDVGVIVAVFASFPRRFRWRGAGESGSRCAGPRPWRWRAGWTLDAHGVLAARTPDRRMAARPGLPFVGAPSAGHGDRRQAGHSALLEVMRSLSIVSGRYPAPLAAGPHVRFLRPVPSKRVSWPLLQ